MCRSSYPGISQAQRGGDWEGSDSEGVSSYISSLILLIKMLEKGLMRHLRQ